MKHLTLEFVCLHKCWAIAFGALAENISAELCDVPKEFKAHILQDELDNQFELYQTRFYNVNLRTVLLSGAEARLL